MSYCCLCIHVIVSLPAVTAVLAAAGLSIFIFIILKSKNQVAIRAVTTGSGSWLELATAAAQQ